MKIHRFATACLAGTLAIGPATRAAADADGIVGGIIGGIIGGAIVNEASKNRAPPRQQTTRAVVPSATRTANAETQTALNYFGFPAGTPDGMMGHNSRNAIAQYQVHLGYPATGQLTQYERDFLVTSYHRAIAGGYATTQMIAANPQGPRGLLLAYRDQLAGVPVAAAPAPLPVPVPAAEPAPAPQAPIATFAAAAPATAMPSFLGAPVAQASLASHCNKISLQTSTNGGFTTLAGLGDPGFALDEQFCLARTYAIAQGEELAGKVQGFTPQQIAEQCVGLAPVLKEQVAALSLQPRDTVLPQVAKFAVDSGMSPPQLAGTARICLSVGYRTDDLDVALASALMLAGLGENGYGELLGHHLARGFGTSARPDLALDWYDAGLAATPVFAPGQPERTELIRKAAHAVGGRPEPAPVQPVPAGLPGFGAVVPAPVQQP